MSTNGTARILDVAKLLMRPNALLILVLGCSAAGFTLWGLQSDRASQSDSEELLDEDESLAEFQGLGAVGVSSSAARTSDLATSAPLTLPTFGENSTSIRDPAIAPADATGPLFDDPIALLNSTSPSETAQSPIAMTHFQQAQASSAGVLPSHGTQPGSAGLPRVSANQAVWLTGTIEFEPSNAGNPQP